MLKITNDKNETVFYGNYWDFSRDPIFLAKLLTQLGLIVEIQKSKNDDLL